MNRPGIGPPPMRAMPAGYPSQQQQQIPQSRSSSTAGRLPNNKMASNGASWGYPNGGPVSAAAAQGARHNLPPMASFAQSISGSQPATPLDLSDFPTLSTNSSQQAASNPIAQSLWASSNARNLAQPSGQRPGQSNSILGHQNQAHHQQDDLFASSSQLQSNQGGFRFGNQNPVGQSAISQQGPPDEFPPLNRNGNGDIGQSVLQMQNSGFGGQSAFGPAIGGVHNQQANGLLNQLTNSRAPSAGRSGSPGGIQGLLASSRVSDMKSRASGNMENDMGAFSRPSQLAPQNNYRDQLAQQTGSVPTEIQSDIYRTFGAEMQRPEPSSRAQDFGSQGVVSETSEQMVEDPCLGMSELERYGIKGYLALVKGPYPDQATLMTGIDPATLGLDLNTSERISETLWSPFDEHGTRPDVPGEGTYEIPECYIVHNVQAIDNKIPNFSDETLFVLFYQNTGDVQQMDAARELSGRNWRYHKKYQVWLTKDMSMNPIQLNATSERGYYTFWNTKSWEREKREFTLNYADLEIID